MEMEVLGRRNSKCKGPKVRKLSISEKVITPGRAGAK